MLAHADEPVAQGTLSGTIVNTEGKPVAGARISLNHSEYDKNSLKSIESTVAETQSDERGHFSLGPIAAANRPNDELRIEMSGCAAQYVPRFSIFPDADNDLGKIRVAPGRVFVGQVFDVDGKPRVGAKVHVEVSRHVMGYTINRIKPEYTVTTDEHGRFRTPPVAVGRVSIYVDEPERRYAFVNRWAKPDGEETLAEPIRLERDVPVVGWVRDEQGRGVEGAVAEANSDFRATSDADGKFVLRGFGPNPNFQMHLTKPGYVFINWSVQVSDDGYRIHDISSDDDKNSSLVQEFVVPLVRSAWIEGRAVDADSGQPVALDKVILCTFERKPNGEIVVGGCRVSQFEQPAKGQFRVEYSRPDEYHLKFTAKGYKDAEAFTPLVKELQPIDGLLVKMHRDTASNATEIQRQTIVGTATRDGRPIRRGWASLWIVQRPRDLVNAYIERGRTVSGEGVVTERALIRDGEFTLDVPSQGPGYFVVVEEPGHAPTQIGPLTIKVNETRKLDVACVEGGAIAGRVSNVPAEWQGNLWAVAFNRSGVRADVQVDLDGTFRFENLPPGRYGLKVGHDAYRDSEVPRPNEFKDIPASAWKTIADPWKRATTVTVESGKTADDVTLELPEEDSADRSSK
jgi:hypothetical protein